MVGGLSVALFCHCQPITQWCVGKEKTVPSSISAAVFFAAESNRCDRFLQVFFVKKGGIRMKILRHKLKPHTLFCIIASVIVLVSYAVFFCIVSKHYTVMLFFSETMNIDSVRIEQSDDKIVAIKEVRREMFLDMIETLSVEVESIHEGDVRLSVFYENTYEGEKTDDTGQTVTEPLVEQSAYEVDLHVTPFGTIYNMTHDSFNGMWTLQLLGCVLSIIWIITLGLAFYEREKNGEFTISIPREGSPRKLIADCGSNSGRDMDKAKEFGFSYVAGETVNVPAVKEYPLVLECKVIYKQLQDENAISPDNLEKFYPKDELGKRDIHMAYTAEITKAYIL